MLIPHDIGESVVQQMARLAPPLLRRVGDQKVRLAVDGGRDARHRGVVHLHQHRRQVAGGLAVGAVAISGTVGHRGTRGHPVVYEQADVRVGHEVRRLARMRIRCHDDRGSARQLGRCEERMVREIGVVHERHVRHVV